MLSINDLSAWHGKDRDKIEIFSQVSLQINPGEILGVFGPNGCGKSTLVRTLIGLHPTNSGGVFLPLEGNKPSASILPQACINSFFEWASLRWNILIACSNPWKNRKHHYHRIEAIKTELGLEIDLSLRPSQCSGGMIQQAAMIRALANNPRLLIADEPFSALDVNVTRKVRKAFRHAIRQHNIAALVVMHDIEDIIDISDHVLVIPGRPFSTKTLPGHTKAEILTNHLKSNLSLSAKNSVVQDSQSFIQIMKTMLEHKNNESAPEEYYQ
jgi:ABC-type nitrate/sulfonate/bicarbonate transport system ATPase subunit